MKRVCMLLALCLLLTLTGCQETPTESDPVSRPDSPTTDVETALQTLALAYSREDTLNPFTTATEANLYLAKLLYDSLTVSDEAFVPQLSLAVAVDTPDATHLVVTLREGAVFSDGSAVTAADVVTSFQRAKKSANYANLLTNLRSATANEKLRQVTFTLVAADVNALGSLTFPVVKASTLTDKEGEAPMGGGVYVYNKTDSGARLTANPHSTVKPHFETVQLRHLPNSTAMYYALSSGEIAYYFDDLDSGEPPQSTGANTPVELNDLVYLGINSGRGKLGQPTVRRALSLLMDRPAILSTVYAGRGLTSCLPFHPHWTPMQQVDSPAVSRNLDGAVKLLDEAGCKPAANGKRLELELLYCTDRADRGRVAELVRTQLEGGGVKVTLVPLEQEEFLKRLSKGNFDLYLGEIRLTADMSLRPLLAGGKAAYGIQRWGTTAMNYTKYLAGELPLDNFMEAFGEDMPYIPLCWRSGFAAYDRRLTTVTPVGYDPYYGLAGWK